MPLATEVWLIVFKEEIHNKLLKYYYTYDYAFIIKMYKNVVSLNNCVNCKQLCRLSQSFKWHLQSLYLLNTQSL